MKTEVFSIYDKKAGAFHTPFFMHNEPMAQRTFINMINDKESRISLNPEDYSLWCLGEFEDGNGLLSSKVKESMTGLDVMAAQKGFEVANNV